MDAGVELGGALEGVLVRACKHSENFEPIGDQLRLIDVSAPYPGPISHQIHHAH